MTRIEHCLELVGDIRDCAMRAKDLGLTGAQLLNGVADTIEHDVRTAERPSSPIIALNQETRATASKHFQETRRILKGIAK